MFHIDHALFAPWHALAGGVMIGAAAGIMALLGGKVMGCSGIAGGNLHDLIEGIPTQGWRWSFLLGVWAAEGFAVCTLRSADALMGDGC
ncbi:MAG: YeeE/YedE family protein, partial [Thiomonas sp.]